MATVRFKEGNSIPYGQDMGIHKGVPSGIDFDVRLENDGNGAVLRAPGYGGKPYGNGAIYLSRSMFQKAIKMFGGWKDE